MNDSGYYETPDIDTSIIDRNYADSAANVRARFKLYEYVAFDNHVHKDISEYSVDLLRTIGKLPIGASVLDVGTADAKLLDYLRINLGHEGPLWGIDPNSHQFIDYEKLSLTATDWKKVNALLRARGVSPLSLSQQRLKEDVPLWQPTPNLVLQAGRAHDLSMFEDNTMDDVFSMFMLYHVPQSQRPQAFSEFDRVLKPDGVLTIATSGDKNKFVHRQFEQEIAADLGIVPPAPMNAGFTTEKAVAEISPLFEHVYQLEQVGTMIIDRAQKVRDYLGSIASLRDQFDPVPDAGDFKDALERLVVPEIEHYIRQNGRFEDKVHRSAFLASHDAMTLYPASGFKSLK